MKVWVEFSDNGVFEPPGLVAIYENESLANSKKESDTYLEEIEVETD